MLPLVVQLELMVDGSQNPISVPEQSQQLVESGALDEDLLSLLNIRDLLAKSGQLDLPVDVFEVEPLVVLVHVLQLELVLQALLHQVLMVARPHRGSVKHASGSRADAQVVEIPLVVFAVPLRLHKRNDFGKVFSLLEGTQSLMV